MVLFYIQWLSIYSMLHVVCGQWCHVLYCTHTSNSTPYIWWEIAWVLTVPYIVPAKTIALFLYHAIHVPTVHTVLSRYTMEQVPICCMYLICIETIKQCLT